MKNKTSTPEDSHDGCCHEDKIEPQAQAPVSNEIASPRTIDKNYFLGICIVIAAAIIGGALLFTLRFKVPDDILSAQAVAELEKTIIPDTGVVLPITWGDLGKQLAGNGSIDMKKFEELYGQRGGLDNETKKLLTATNNGQPVITKDNANVLLNVLWALGLANKNEILEKGPMVEKQYGGNPGQFASTGGWTLAVGNPMDHYSRHSMISLTPEQQSLVERVSKNIYRPCCGNSTYFPDCNHGMAMLGLLELMASQGVNEADMYKAALAVNVYWFPDTYITIGQFFKMKDIAWKSIDPKAILGSEYSSGAGFQNIKSQVAPVPQKGGGSCAA